MRFAVIILCAIGFTACSVDPRIAEPVTLKPEIPSYVPPAVYNFQNNPLTDGGFQLGRALFYEPMLSSDNSISCASCHQQEAAFANLKHQFSHGVNEKIGNRNSPGIFNARWHPYFMHDGGINHIEVQPFGPIGNPVEMNEKMENVINKLKASTRYRKLFTDAFGSDTIHSQIMMRAMAQFMGAMYSFGSKYDQYKQGEKGVTFTESELNGYSLFLEKCNACHKEPLFSDFAMRSNGIKPDPQLADSGRAHVTGEKQDKYKFKTPSLRNITFTSPYMHDGRFETLEQCVDHYSGNDFNRENLDPLLANGVSLTADQKKDIIAFLRTLSDYTFVHNKAFSDPNYNQ
jgi:cytochrome c peroxidase